MLGHVLVREFKVIREPSFTMDLGFKELQVASKAGQ